jgi:hypothetical protein
MVVSVYVAAPSLRREVVVPKDVSSYEVMAWSCMDGLAVLNPDAGDIYPGCLSDEGRCQQSGAVWRAV